MKKTHIMCNGSKITCTASSTRFISENGILIFNNKNGFNSIDLKGDIDKIAIDFYNELERLTKNDSFEKLNFCDQFLINTNMWDIEYIGVDKPIWFDEFLKFFRKSYKLRTFS